MPDKTLKVPRSLTRAASMAEMGDDGKTVKLSISSDEPYLRYDWWNDEEYWEVLDHGPNGIDDERLKAGLPILFNHERSSHLGRGQSFENDGHKLSVVAKFSESPFAQEKLADVKSGVLVDSSVGYELIGEGICIGAKEEKPIYKFRFKVYEGSLVTIPADATVGVGRQRDNKPSDEPREILIKGIDDNSNSDNTKTTKGANSPQMKTTSLVRSHFMLKQEGGEGGVSDAAEITPADLAKIRADARAEFKARCKRIDDFVAALKNEAWRKKAEVIAAKHKLLDEPDFEAFRTEANDQFTTETNVDTEGQRSGVQVIGERGEQPGTIGERFVRSKQYKDQLGMRGQRTIAVDYDRPILGARGKANLNQRAGFTSSDLSAVNVQIQTGVIGLGIQRLTIMDLIAPGTTAAAAIIYPRENSFGALDGVAFSTSAGVMPKAGTVGERGIKPLWEPDLTTETANVKKIAVTTKVPDEFMADFPAAQSYIDERLPYMVDTRTEEQILYGDGVGNNLKGIFTNQNVQTRAITTTDDSTKAASLRQGLTDVSVGSMFEPDGFGFHPYDWETAQLLKDSTGRFLAGGPYYIPLTSGVFVELHTFWGKPVAVTTAVNYGQPLCGAWKLGAQYFVREGMRIEMTNANEDDFRRNLICLRAEHRLALATYRPVAFLQFTGWPARA